MESSYGCCIHSDYVQTTAISNAMTSPPSTQVLLYLGGWGGAHYPPYTVHISGLCSYSLAHLVPIATPTENRMHKHPFSEGLKSTNKACASPTLAILALGRLKLEGYKFDASFDM